MTKKAKKVVPTKEDIQRRNMINEFNRNNEQTKILMRKVTEDDIKSLENDLKSMQEKHATAVYLIADKDNAIRVFEFLKDWNSTKFMWTKDLWKGILTFDNYLNEWKTKYDNEACDLEFDFAAMSYTYNMLMNCAGLGFDSAKFMEAVSEQYESILNTLSTYVEDFKKDNERFKLLQDCLAARYQGFMMVPADSLELDNQDCDDESVSAVTEDCDNVISLVPEEANNDN